MVVQKRETPIVSKLVDTFSEAVYDAGCPVCGGRFHKYCQQTLWDETTRVYKCRDCGAVTFAAIVKVE